MTETTRPASFRIEEGADDDVTRLVAVLDLIAGTPGVQRLRSWAREVLAVRPGERVVDLGAGTGDEVQVLAAAVGPTGRAFGVEPNPGLLAEAARRASESGSTARFVDGNAYALPFEDSTVDVVSCERVLQHLDEPGRATAEMARVLRPGGRALVIDTDWSTVIVHPGDPAVVDAVHRFWLGRFANPYSGRLLAGQLTAAGLTVDDIGSQALIQPPAAIDGMLEMTNSLATADGAITEEQRAQLTADLRAGVERGDFHFSVTMFAVLAHKPLR